MAANWPCQWCRAHPPHSSLDENRASFDEEWSTLARYRTWGTCAKSRSQADCIQNSKAIQEGGGFECPLGKMHQKETCPLLLPKAYSFARVSSGQVSTFPGGGCCSLGEAASKQQAMPPPLLESERGEESLMWRQAPLVPKMCASERGRRALLSDAIGRRTECE